MQGLGKKCLVHGVCCEWPYANQEVLLEIACYPEYNKYSRDRELGKALESFT